MFSQVHRVTNTLTLALSMLVLSMNLALAQNTTNKSDQAVTQATAHFERGLELHKDGHFAGALSEFRRAYQIAPHYQLHHNLAVVLSAMHRYTEAITEFGLYLEQGGDQLGKRQRTQIVKELSRLQERIATITIIVNVEDARIVIDGFEFPRGTSSRQINMGSHKITVSASGYHTQSRGIDILGKDKQELSFTLVAVATPATDSNVAKALLPTPTSATKDTGATKAWIATGTALTLGLGAALTGSLALRADTDLDTAFSQQSPSTTKVKQLRDRIGRYATTTDVLGGLALIAGGVSIYLWTATGDTKSSEGNLHLSTNFGTIQLSGVFQ